MSLASCRTALLRAARGFLPGCLMYLAYLVDVQDVKVVYLGGFRWTVLGVPPVGLEPTLDRF